MTNSIQEHLNQITRKESVYYLDISNRDLTGEASLSEFTNLNGFNASNNQFENLDFLNTLPQKEKLTSLNLFGNQIKEVDLAWLLSTFPNLKRINFSKNPVRAKNLNNLTSEQFGKIVTGLKNKQIQLNCWNGTILIDLLERAQQLISQGSTNSQTNSHLVYLKSLTQSEVPQKKAKVEASNKQKNDTKTTSINYLLVGSLVLIGMALLTIGYWLGKKKQSKNNNIYFDEN